jgi:hypothetical protein
LGKLVFSQQYLNSTYITQGLAYPPTNIIPTDSGYIIGSSTANTIYLLDSSANEKWFKQYPLSLPGGYGNLISDNNGKYIASGTLQGGIDGAYLIKFNNSFDTIYSKILITETICSSCLSMVHCFVDNNGKYILLGHNSRDSSGVSIPDVDALFIKTDTSGTIINHKLIGPSNNADWFNTGLQMGNNYYLFGGTYSYAPGSVVGMDRTDGWIVKTDLQGNEISSAAFGNPNIYDHDFIFTLKTHQNKLLTGVDYGIAKHSSGFRMFKPRLLVLNDDLSVYKDLFFKNSYVSNDTLFNSSIVDGILNIDSTYTFLGRDVAVSISTHSGLHSNGFVLKLNKSLKVLYFRNYIHNGGNYTSIIPTVIASTADSGYIFGGYVNDNTLTPSQQSWLVKTDSLGCDGFHSCDDTTLVCQILQAPDTACKNDTSWIHVKFKGRSAPYFIYANTTLALDSVYYPYTLPLWIDTLMPYFPTTTGMQQVIVKLQDPWGWYQTDTVQIFVKNCGSGSIEETWYPKKVEVFPNPATNELHVKIRSAITTPVSITIYDMQGKVVKQIATKLNETVINISGLKEGVYGIRVVGDNITVSDRFVKLE